MSRRRSNYPRRGKYTSKRSLTKNDINGIIIFGLIALCVYFWYISIPLAIILIVLGIMGFIGKASSKNNKKSVNLKNPKAQTITEKTYTRSEPGTISAQNASNSTLALNIDSMNGHDFEQFFAGLLKKTGYKNVVVTPKSGDHGIDVVAEKRGIRYAFQCKRYTGKVPNKAVQEAHSGMNFYDSKHPVVVTNSYFSRQAIQEAHVLHVELWNRPILLKMIKDAGITLQAPATGGYQTKDYKPVTLTGQSVSAHGSLYPAPKYDAEKGIYIEAFNEVGTDIPPGRYILSTRGNGTGRIEIYDSFENYKNEEVREMKTFNGEYRLVLSRKGMFIYIENTSLVLYSS